MDVHGRVLERRYASYEMIKSHVDKNAIMGDRAYSRHVSRTAKNRKRVQARVSVSKGIARNSQQAKKMVQRGAKVDVKVVAKSRAIAKGPVKRKPYYEKKSTSQARGYCLKDKTGSGKKQEWWKLSGRLRKK